MKRLFAVLFCLLMLCGCSTIQETVFHKDEQITNSKQLEGKTIGIITGSIYEDYIKNNFKNSKIVYVNSRPELILALKANKIDSFLTDGYIAELFASSDDELYLLNENFEEINNAFCFSKRALDLRDEFNAYLANCKENGYLDYLEEKWVTNFSGKTRVEVPVFYGDRGTIEVLTSSDAMPMSFIADNSYQGYEIELFYSFCTYAGYVPNISNGNFDSIITGIVSNKYDVSFTGVTVTEERKKSVDFSDPVYTGYSKIVVLNHENSNSIIAGGSNNKISFIDSFVDKFNKMFIEEERWLLLLHGIRITFEITIASLFIGTFLGFIIYLICRKSNPILRKIFDRLSFIINRIPTILILMFLFYIVFSTSSIAGEYVSIIGFSLIETLSVYSMLNNGIDAIDKGQTDAALALGYSDTKTLFKFVLPQALKIIMPSYKSDVVSLIKSTSIVGYITVEDLTRVSDIIRSRTYEAFFPLFVSAIVYFALAWLLSLIVEKIQNKVLPSEKTQDQIISKYK